MFSPLRTYNGGVEGGGSHFQVLLRYSRWLALPLPRYASRGTRGMPLSSARTFPGIFLTAAPSQPDLWVNACITNLLGGEALERWKQDKLSYFLKVNLNEMGHRNAFDGLVRTWGLGLGILVAGMHRYVGLSCRHTDSPTINPSLVNRVGCAHITNLHMQLHNRPPLNHFLGFTAPNPSSCLLHVQNAALIDWGWGWGIQKLILNFCRLLPPSLTAYSAASVINWGGSSSGQIPIPGFGDEWWNSWNIVTSLEITAPNGFPDIVKIAPRTIVHPREKYLIKAALHSHSWPIGLIRH